MVVAGVALLVGAGAGAALESDTVGSYGRGLWWAISLMTTVGFLGSPSETRIAARTRSGTLTDTSHCLGTEGANLGLDRTGGRACCKQEKLRRSGAVNGGLGWSNGTALDRHPPG